MTWLIGITGGIGSGKTTVCKIFESAGIPVYYADTRAKYLMNHHRPLKQRIKEILGDAAYHRNGRLNRPYVAQKIFSNKNLLKSINSAVHPAVHEDAAAWYSKQKDVPYVLYEAALLVENGSYKSFHKLIVVTAPEDMRIQRVINRDKVSRKEVHNRVRNQLPESEKAAVADYIINNDETSAVEEIVIQLHHKILSDIDNDISKPNRRTE
jgi:dephospho-CoA kinase